jgi:hypothetical protein
MQLAKQEAQRFNHEHADTGTEHTMHIGTEHILFGIIKEGKGIAASVLRNRGISLEKIRTYTYVYFDTMLDKRAETGKLVGVDASESYDYQVKGKLLPLVDLAIDYSLRAAERLQHNYIGTEHLRLQHNYIGTEHLLLGLIATTEGAAAKILQSLGVKLVDLEKEILDLVRKGDGGEEYSATKEEDMSSPRRGGEGTESKGESPEEVRCRFTCSPDKGWTVEDEGKDGFNVKAEMEKLGEGLKKYGPLPPLKSLLRFEPCTVGNTVIGDMVMLKSGGPLMTVTGVSREGQLVQCSYFSQTDRGEWLMNVNIMREALKKVACCDKGKENHVRDNMKCPLFGIPKAAETWRDGSGPEYVVNWSLCNCERVVFPPV